VGDQRASEARMKSVKYNIWNKLWTSTNYRLVHSETVKELIRDQAWEPINEWIRHGIGREILKQVQK